MKTTIYLAIAFFALPMLLAAFTPIVMYAPDRMSLPGYNQFRDSWRVTERMDYYYDFDGWEPESRADYYYNQTFPSRPDSVKQWAYDFEMGTWEEAAAQYATFNNLGYVTQVELSYNWFGAMFPFMRSNYVYDNQNRLTKMYMYMAGIEDREWFPVSRMHIVYETNSIYQVFAWSAMMDIREGIYNKIAFTWDAQGRVIEETEYTSPDSLNWTLSSRTTRTYHPNDTLTGDQFLHWVAWTLPMLIMMDEQDFPGMVSEEYYSYWDGTQWVPEEKELNAFNAQDQMVLSHSFYWDGSGWIDSYRQGYVYDGNGNLSTLTEEYYDTGMMSWMYASQSTFDWEMYTSATDDPGIPAPSDARLKAYPVPFSEALNLRFESSAKALVNYRIYNLRGQQVGELSALPNTTTTWNSGINLPSGIYFVKATQGDVSRVTRILKVK